MKAILFLAVLLVAVTAQVPIPKRPDGFPLGSTCSAPITLDVFFDPLCPDCAEAWPTVKALVPKYGTNLHIRMHTFPLPYHTWAFVAAQGVHVAASVSNTTLWSYVDTIFANQAAFWNDQASRYTQPQVVAALAQLMESKGVMSASALVRGLNDANFNMATRVSWKYGCTRGVAGTATFFVNGVIVNGESNWTVADWAKVLDPLLS